MIKSHLRLKILVKVFLSILFLGCLLDMPYGYYQAVRFLGMLGFIYLAWNENRIENKIYYIIWVSSALLINPFIKISLGRTIWNVVDIIWAGILLVSIIKDVKLDNNKPIN